MNWLIWKSPEQKLFSKKIGTRRNCLLYLQRIFLGAVKLILNSSSSPHFDSLSVRECLQINLPLYVSWSACFGLSFRLVSPRALRNKRWRICDISDPVPSRCSCPSGYSGASCEVIDDPCDSHDKCSNDGVCRWAMIFDLCMFLETGHALHSVYGFSFSM